MKIPAYNTLIKYHIFLGIALNFIPQLYIFHHWVFFLSFLLILVQSINNKERFNFLFLAGFAYFPLLESLGRLHLLDPFVPWEWGKYYAIFSVILLLFTNKLVFDFPFFLGFLMIITTLIKGNTEWKLVFFNAIITMALLLMRGYFKKCNLTRAGFFLIIKYAFLVLIIFLLSSITKLQDFKTDELELDSKFVLDEIPSNQIATYMGLGFFMGIILFKERIKLFFNGYQTGVLFGFAMLIIGVISFSRGGIIVGIIGVVLLYFNRWKSFFQFKYIKQLIILIPIVIGFVAYLNSKTNGNLLLRYSGETNGTLAGSKEKGINTLTTNRYNIMIGDLVTFSQNPLFGVEVGRSREYRIESEKQYSHVEFSRLLAEHGIIGLGAIIVILEGLFRTRNGISNHVKFSLYLVAFLTTFHGATRTSLPLLMMLIPLVKIDKKFAK